ncbi:MAG: O-antigen ligase domain-containing protein [Flavobacterium sp.]|nr:MAG: O-antigen ligase domain-containing protein [Flavobacterium sp.]
MKAKNLFLRLLIFSIPFNELSVIIPQIRVPTFIFFFYLLTAIGDMKFTDMRLIKKPFYPLLLLYITIFLSSFLNFVPGYNFGSSYLRQFVIYIIFFYFITIEFTRGTIGIKDGLKMYNYGVYFFLSFVILGIDTNFKDGRLSILGTNANLVGVFCVSSILITTYFHWEKLNKKSYHHIIFAVKIVLLLLAIASSGSRGAFFSMLLTTGIYIIFLQRHNIRRVQYGFIALIAGGMMTLVMLSSGKLAERLLEDDDLSASRTEIWSAALEVMGNNYFMGIGLFTYQRNIEELMGRMFAVHNEFLAIFIYSGVLGILFLLTMLWHILKAAYTFYKRFNNPILLSLLIGILFAASKGGGVFISINTWFFFSLIYASKYLVPTKNYN